MLCVEVIVVEGDLRGKAAGCIWVRSADDRAAVELTPAGCDTDLFRSAGAGVCERLGRMQFGVDQPNALREEGYKQKSGEKLRTAKPLACEKSGHKGEPECFTMAQAVWGNGGTVKFVEPRRTRRCTKG